MEILAVDMTALATQVYNVILAALGLGLVIFLHELGHFAVAKWCDVYVERFSIGFGPVFFSRKWGETEYALSLIPFGGYVKMLGQDDADPSQLTNEEIAEDPRSYVAKSVGQRMAIISAGVTMNVLTAFLFFIVVFLAGLPTFPSDIGKARPGMPAWEAGILAGDMIEKINDSPISTYPELQMSVAFSSGALKLDGKHLDGTPFSINVDPDTTQSHPQIGVMPMESLIVYDAVPGLNASRATPAFKRDDVITKVGNQEVKNAVEFHRAVATNPGSTLDITVQRKVEGESKSTEGEPKTTSETITITDNYFRTLGLILDPGPIVAVRKGSPADKAGLKKGDKLATLDGLNIGTQIDPLKLPVEFAKRAGNEVTVAVTRQIVGGGQEKVELKLVPEDVPGWMDQPETPGEPLSIDSVGAALHIMTNVLSVVPDSPAEKANIKPQAALKKMVLTRRADLPNNEDAKKDTSVTIKFEDAKDEVNNTNNFAYAFWMMQQLPLRKITLTVVEGDKTRDVEVTPELDTSWPLPEIGVELQPVKLVQKADSFGEACMMSIKHTRSSALNTYLTLRSLATGRVSYKELHGPIGIAKAAYRFAHEGWVAMLLFLGFLSMNLAVLNFLPIPVLDGGHMVFLLWEAVTGRKPNEKLFIGAQFAGLAFLICLMGLVIYLDVFVHGFAKK